MTWLPIYDDIDLYEEVYEDEEEIELKDKEAEHFDVEPQWRYS